MMTMDKNGIHFLELPKTFIFIYPTICKTSTLCDGNHMLSTNDHLWNAA